MEWQTIESAPRDGSAIWVGCSHSIAVGFWNGQLWEDLKGGYNIEKYFIPTHWQTLPKPPEDVPLP